MTHYYSEYNLEAEIREEFANAQGRATLRKWLRLGQNTDLKSFSDAYQMTNNHNRSEKGIQLIRIEHIVGSVSENRNFDDHFNPRHPSSQDRWVRLYIGFINGDPIPPIEVYQIGECYFVEDGHHRVSVARHIGNATIEARIIKIETGCYYATP